MIEKAPGIGYSPFSVSCNGVVLPAFLMNKFELPVSVARSFGTSNKKNSIEITIPETIKKAAIKPNRLGIIPEIVNGKITFTIESENYCAVEFDDFHRLLLFFEPEINPPVDAILLDITSGGGVFTKIIQQAIDSLSENGGGTLHIPDGIYEIGTLTLKSNVCLWLSSNTVLMGSCDPADYPSDTTAGHEGMIRRLIFCQNATNVSIKGNGFIFGRGAELRGGPCGSNNLIRFIHCKNIEIEGIYLLDSPKWTTHLLVCEDVSINRLKTINEIPVLNTALSFHPGNNTDGINPDGCKNVTIRNCFMHCGDDCFVVKASGASGVATDISENITVRNCMAYSFAAGVKIGTETRCDSIRNISFDNIDMIKVGTFITISIWDWTHVKNVLFSNIRCDRAHHMSFDIAIRQRKPEQQVGHLDNLILENISLDNFPRGCFEGFNELHLFRNIIISDLRFNNKKITQFSRTPIVTNDFIKGILFE